MAQGNTFYETAIILSLAAVLGIIGQKLRQPLVIMFLVTGVLAGPAALGVIYSYEQIELLAHIGIALLLFIVGLKLDLNLIRTTGPVALATGLGQILFTSVIGFVIALGLGLAVISAVYVAVALTFSSTIIIVKLLSDKKEIDALHGRIAVGFLIVQDIAAILALVALTTFGSPLAQGQSPVATWLLMTVKGIGLLVGVGLLMRYVLPRLLAKLAHSQEMLVLFAIAWAVLLGATSEGLGFSKEIGAFLAGISLATSEFRDLISAKLVSLRDFLLLFFFIDLGARLDWSTVGAEVGRSLWLSLFVLVGNPVIVLIIMGVMGYRRRTSFLAGLTVAQISEFSLIVGALGVALGHIPLETMGLITLVGVVTICASTYMILYSQPLYQFLSPALKIFERKDPYRESTGDTAGQVATVDVILVGLGNYGSGLAERLLERRRRIVGVDFDPQALKKWQSRGVSVLYGDMADPELFEQLPLRHAHWVVSTVRSKDVSLTLLRLLKQGGYQGKVALTAADQAQATLYESAGAHVILRPFRDAAEQAADALTDAMDLLPQNVDWPVAFQEVRLRSGSTFAGQKLRDIPLRSLTGVSVLAVSRAGHAYYEPPPDFRVYPGDRIVLMGSPGVLKQAESLVNQMETVESVDKLERFEVTEVPLDAESDWLGKTLAELQFRQRYGVTVVGIRRDDERLASPGPNERLLEGDRLIVIGTADKIGRLTLSEATTEPNSAHQPDSPDLA
ncbi:MAG: cation:proton antiporter [Sedimentisphaerales bacterium]|nr:cation:proton antiporter [Sedimentisphaerales bacterium]